MPTYWITRDNNFGSVDFFYKKKCMYKKIKKKLKHTEDNMAKKESYNNNNNNKWLHQLNKDSFEYYGLIIQNNFF